MSEGQTGYDGMTASELLDIIRKTWIEHDLKQVIGSAPPDDDYSAAVIIDCAVYATPADELAALRDQLAAAQAENARLRAALEAIITGARISMDNYPIPGSLMNKIDEIAREALDGGGE